MKKSLLLFLILNSVTVFSNENNQLSNTINIDSYLDKQNITTPLLIKNYQEIWNHNKKELLKKKKLIKDDKLVEIINEVTSCPPSEILSDKKTLAIVKKIIKDQNCVSLHRKAEMFTQLQKTKEARSLWSKCHFSIAEFCQTKLKKQGIILDIREQKDEPYYNVNFDMRKIDEINKFFLLNNKNINKPECVTPYIKTILIFRAIVYQKALPTLFPSSFNDSDF